MWKWIDFVFFFRKIYWNFSAYKRFSCGKMVLHSTHTHIRQANRIGKHTFFVTITIKWHANAFDFHIGSQQPLLGNVKKTIVRLIGRNEFVNREIERTSARWWQWTIVIVHVHVNGFDSMHRRTPLASRWDVAGISSRMWCALVSLENLLVFVTFEKIENVYRFPRRIRMASRNQQKGV